MVLNDFNVPYRYGVIYSDPPWPQEKSNPRKVRPLQKKEFDYPILSFTEIKEIHRDVLDKLADEKHNLFIWTIDRFLPQTEWVMKDLGYILHARLIWDKTNGIAPAFTVRYSHEYLLWFYQKGGMLLPRPAVQGKYATVMREPSTKHSKKPNCAYEMLEDMFPDVRKVELFARNEREGWDCWGNEV